jgi:hypothetical protein
MAQIAQPVMGLPHPYYAAIGEFLFRFAQLEYQLNEIIWSALQLDYKTGRTLTIGSDVKVLCQTIKTIANTRRKIWIKDPTLIQEMNSIANTATSLRERRNAIAHGSWQSTTGQPIGAILHFMKNDRILPRADKSIDDRRIASDAAKLHDLNQRAKKLIAALGGPRS